MTFTINPSWKYIPLGDLIRHPMFKALLKEFDKVMGENTRDLTVRLYSRETMITRYTTALWFWMSKDPLKMCHVDTDMEDLHDMGRMENSLVFKSLKDSPIEQELSKVCGTVFNYIYHRLFTHHHDLLWDVRARLMSTSKL